MPLESSLKANEQTSLVSTDWWIIPKNAPNARRANDFLKCMYSENDAIAGAQKFQFAQGYSLPLEGLQIEDPISGVPIPPKKLAHFEGDLRNFGYYIKVSQYPSRPPNEPCARVCFTPEHSDSDAEEIGKSIVRVLTD
jgi:7-keto-8-aminopelargonate synthetase-like enzyme